MSSFSNADQSFAGTAQSSWDSVGTFADALFQLATQKEDGDSVYTQADVDAMKRTDEAMSAALTCLRAKATKAQAHLDWLKEQMRARK